MENPMDYEILNNGQPDENGDIVAIIRNTEGRITSTFKGKTYEEMMPQILESQVHANREIARLRKPDAAREPIKVEPKELTAADRLRLSSEITDPQRVVEAVTEIVSARTGISPDRLGAEFARMSDEEQIRFFDRQVQSFLNDYPDYYPVPQNMDAMIAELDRNKWQATRNNLALAYHSLKEKGKLISRGGDGKTTEPDAGPNPQANGNGHQAPTAYVPRERTVATTGLRNSDASALPPSPQPRKKPYTRADIERMSRAEYSDKLQNEPGFRQLVDAM